MPIPDDVIVDNRKRSLGGYLNEVLEGNPGARLDIATAFFEVGAYSILKDGLGSVKTFRLLLGKSPEFKFDGTLGQELERLITSGLKDEVESLDLSEENESAVQKLIKFLKLGKVEVRLYDSGFLHGKAYIFDNLVVVGSSNFTAAGLEHNGELNTVHMKSEAKYVREEWFEKFWDQSKDFKAGLIQLLEDSRFGSAEYTPYQVFIKTLYELQKSDLPTEDVEDDDRESVIDLADFQQDAITRINNRLNKYGFVLIADSVGLGKTKIASKIIEEHGFFKRRKFLVVCPAQLREMWKSELKDLNTSEYILSLEDLATEDYIEKAKQVTNDKLSEIALIVVDESHNLRNPFSNRFEHFFSLLQDHISDYGKRPKIVFLTATPINNSIMDLYYQVSLLTGGNDSCFAEIAIPSLSDFFKDAFKRNEPSLLNDLLNEMSIRRTRDYIVKNYPHATIHNKPVKFPKRSLENVNYKLDSAYQGMYREIADTVSTKLTMAHYKLFSYKKDPSKVDDMYQGRMIALSGIFRTLLLKRLESSVDAFRKSIRTHVDFLKKFSESIKQGKLLSKDLYRKYLQDLEESEDITNEDVFSRQLKLASELDNFRIEDYDKERLFKDIKTDIELLSKIKDRVDAISTEKDSKLVVFKKKMLELSKTGQQSVVFTYFADTLDYVYKDVKADPRFNHLKIQKISGALSGKEREEIVHAFRERKIDIIMSTDVLSEGQNLQTAQYILNYDLHWNPTRMIQRAGRIDRIGSPFDEIFVYNFFPEDELEELLRLVQILQDKIINIDSSIGLDQSILGETIHPKVFGTIKRIQKGDESLFIELENDMFGGGEVFYQPLKQYLNEKGREEIEAIPNGIYSGLKKGKGNSIFFYYQYDKKYHYWFLVDPINFRIIEKNKTRILEHIVCHKDKERVIPNFFDSIYECNKIAVQEIERSYKELEQQSHKGTGLTHLSKESSAKFLQAMLAFISNKVDEHIREYPTDRELGNKWDDLKAKLVFIPTTKKRLGQLRKIYKSLKEHKDWKKSIKELEGYAKEKREISIVEIEPFNPKKIRLISVDLIS